jgi:predicted transcriptional regulator
MVLTHVYLQTMTENEEIANLLEENRAEVDFLLETYNGYKELLDQHKLTEELEQLLAYVHCKRLQVNNNLSLLCRRMDKLHDFLVRCKNKKLNRKLPSLKAIWEAGDLRPKLEALNRGIVRIRTHWKVC